MTESDESDLFDLAGYGPTEDVSQPATEQMAETFETESRDFLATCRALGIGDDLDDGWHAITQENVGEALDDLGDEDGDFAGSAVHQFAALSNLVTEASLEAEEKEGSEPALFPILVDENGNLKAVKLPRVCADGEKVILKVGDYVGDCAVNGKSLKIGALKGEIEAQKVDGKDGNSWYKFSVNFKSTDSGDRFLVPLRTLRDVDKSQLDDAADEDRLVTVLDSDSSGGGYGKAINMASLDITPKGEAGYPVLEVRKVTLKDGKRSFNVLVIEKDGAPVEVSSRSAIDAQLTAGFNVERIRAAGKRVELRIFAKNPLPGREGVFEVEATLKKLGPAPALSEAKADGNRAKRLTAKKTEEKESELSTAAF